MCFPIQDKELENMVKLNYLPFQKIFLHQKLALQST